MTDDLVGGGLALAVSSLFVLSSLTVVWWLDRHERGPLGWVGGAFLCGGIAAVLTAILGSIAPADTVRAVMTQPGGLMVLPAAEEVLKALCLGLILGVAVRFDSPTDGLVYGTATGLGFAMVQLAAGMLGDSRLGGGTLAAAAGNSALVAAVHGLASSAFAGAVGIARLANAVSRRVAWIGLGLMTAIACHAAWGAVLKNYPPTTDPNAWVAGAVMVSALCVAFAVLLVGSVLGEGRIIMTELGDEVSLGVLPAWVRDVIPSYGRRIRSAWWPRRQERAVISRLLIRLAFRKHALRGLKASEIGVAGLEVVQLRQRLRRMLDIQESPGE